MGQTEVLKILYKAKTDSESDEYLTVEEISELLGGQNIRNIRRQLNQLQLYNAVICRTHAKWGVFSNGHRWKRDYALKDKMVDRVKMIIERDNKEGVQNNKDMAESSFKRTPKYTV